MRLTKYLFATLLLLIGITACTKEPKSTYVAFPSSSYSYDEDSGQCKLQIRLYNTPYYYPVKVNVSVATACDYPLNQLIKYDQTEGFEIGIDNTLYFAFTPIDNDYLNEVKAQFKITITKVEGSEIGSTSTTTVTIVDDEHASRITTGEYKVENPSVEGGGQTTESFNLKLVKTGKYEYVAYNWFGLDRPRLVGVYDPEASTLTFDGVDYNAIENDEADSVAFGRAYYFNKVDRSEVLVFKGAGADGKQPIVIKTEKIAQDATGLLLNAVSGCAYNIYSYSFDDKGAGSVGAYARPYNAMNDNAKFSYISQTDDEEEDDDDTRSGGNGPMAIDKPIRVF